MVFLLYATQIVEKEMAVRKGRALIPTEYGIRLIGILPEVLQSPEMTGEWEAKLSRIGSGNGSPEMFMAEICELTREIVDFAKKQGNTGIKETQSVGTCPLCGSPVREYDKAYYCVNKDCGFRKIYKAVEGLSSDAAFGHDAGAFGKWNRSDRQRHIYYN